ncbi:MAG: hypothetical protein PHW72_03840 [Candidatus Pacebacteria bacterium]|nr:hypothetical protein [Candidatus Paceibacterota bacterium]
MIPKLKEKEKAITLRKSGFSLSEIIKEVPVAKSTLSLWLKSVGLSKAQKQRLTEKKLCAMKRGWEARHQQKLTIIKEIKDRAKLDIDHISKRELWMMGIMLYWAEGSKERGKATGIKFSNSDPLMIKLFLEWLKLFCGVKTADIYFEIYLHETATERKETVKNFWVKKTNFPLDHFREIIWKKHKVNTKRKNIGDAYVGQLRVCVKRSANLNRKIAGWIEGICLNCRVV